MGSDSNASNLLYAALLEAQRRVAVSAKETPESVIAVAGTALRGAGLLARRASFCLCDADATVADAAELFTRALSEFEPADSVGGSASRGELMNDIREWFAARPVKRIGSARILEIDFAIVHVASGEILTDTIEFPVHTGDGWDRELARALHLAMSVWIRDILLIRTGGRPEKKSKPPTEDADVALESAFREAVDAIRRVRPEESRSDDEIRDDISNWLMNEQKPVTDGTIRGVVDAIVAAGTSEAASPEPQGDAAGEPDGHLSLPTGPATPISTRAIKEAVSGSKWATASFRLLEASAGGDGPVPVGDPWAFLEISGCDLTTKGGRDWLREELRAGIRWGELETYRK